jgi:elongation of very long chain fatty acids protein 6
VFESLSTMSLIPLKLGMLCVHRAISSLAPGSVRASLLAWIPDAKTMYDELTVQLEHDDPSSLLKSFQGFDLNTSENSWWVGLSWSRFTSQHWEVPLLAVAVYVVMIPSLKWYIKTYGKWNVRNAAFYWNAALSLFSWFGVFACVPVLINGFALNGFYFTCCAPAQWYSDGLSGLFVTLFIYSKVAELVDTVLLLLAGKPVIALQWWHHSTVLLYCWHSYSASIATGLWFAAMNYAVHSVMYGYFAATASKFRKVVTPFAIFITLAQLLQMVVGMYVTVRAVLYQAEGNVCHVNKTNSILGLLMYFSYFVLFFKLFVDNYLLKKKSEDRLPEQKRLSTLKLVRSATHRAMKDLSPSAGSDELSDSQKKIQ